MKMVTRRRFGTEKSLDNVAHNRPVVITCFALHIIVSLCLRQLAQRMEDGVYTGSFRLSFCSRVVFQLALESRLEHAGFEKDVQKLFGAPYVRYAQGVVCILVVINPWRRPKHSFSASDMRVVLIFERASTNAVAALSMVAGSDQSVKPRWEESGAANPTRGLCSPSNLAQN